jgi:phospholipase/carboxylesterase
MTNDPHDPHGGQPVRHYGAALKDASAAMILLHGRGASAGDILGLAGEFYSSEMAYLAPEAANHTWYPYSFLAPMEQNEPWLSSALAKVGSVVDEAIAAGIAREKIVFAGFSQGACLTTEFVARNAARYGAVMAFTGGLIGPPERQFEFAGSLAGTPVFFGSGDPDPHVPWERVKQSAEIYTKMGAVVTLRRYPGMPHTISRAELDEAKAIMTQLV